MRKKLTKLRNRRRSTSTRGLKKRGVSAPAHELRHSGSRVRELPFCRDSRHSKVISRLYLSVKRAGLLRILTSRRDTTDMVGDVGVLDRWSYWEGCMEGSVGTRTVGLVTKVEQRMGMRWKEEGPGG